MYIGHDLARKPDKSRIVRLYVRAALLGVKVVDLVWHDVCLTKIGWQLRANSTPQGCGSSKDKAKRIMPVWLPIIPFQSRLDRNEVN